MCRLRRCQRFGQALLWILNHFSGLFRLSRSARGQPEDPDESVPPEQVLQIFLEVYQMRFHPLGKDPSRWIGPRALDILKHQGRLEFKAFLESFCQSGELWGAVMKGATPFLIRCFNTLHQTIFCKCHAVLLSQYAVGGIKLPSIPY